MALPAFYTEETLATFLMVCLSNAGKLLGWTASSDEILEAVNETLIAYGVDTISQATDIPLLRAHARVQAWRAACEGISALFDHEADGAKFSREKLHSHALAQLASAQKALEALQVEEEEETGSSYGGGHTVSVPNQAVW